MRRFTIALAALAFLVGLPLAAGTAAAATPGAGNVWIGGQPTAGRTWVARTSGWPSDAVLTYQWFLDASQVPFAAGASTSVPAADLGHTVTVKVTGVSSAGTAAVTAGPLRVQGDNPLAGDQWNAPDGPYQATWDGTSWVSYPDGTVHAPAAIQNRPRVTWMTAPDDKVNIALSTQLAAKLTLLRRYIAISQNGNPNALTQLAIFGIYSVQGGEQYLHTPLSNAEVSTYKNWITAFTQTLGQTRVAIVLEPDLAITTNPTTASRALRQSLTRWAAYTLRQDRNASVYLSAGDADWLTPTQAADLLKASGIAYVRGFDLGDTHYSTVGADLIQGAAIVRALTGIGYANKHFVIDTSDNGKGFGFSQDPKRLICASKSSPPPCITLGVPPTWQVIDTKVPLTATQKSYALRYQDADLWIGRPWNNQQAWPYIPSWGYALAASSPYA